MDVDHRTHDNWVVSFKTKSILRKSSDMQKTNPTCEIHKGYCASHSNSRSERVGCPFMNPKTRVWNSGGVRLPACDALERIARAADADENVWRGSQLPLHGQGIKVSKCWEHLWDTRNLCFPIWTGSGLNTKRSCKDEFYHRPKDVAT